MKRAVRPFLPPPDPGAPPSPPLWDAGVLEGIASAAGLTPKGAFDLSWAYEYADEQALARGMLSAGGIGSLVGPAREAEVRAAIVDALAPHRTSSGGYRLQNEWHCLVASP